MTVVDTASLVAVADRREALGPAVEAVLRDEPGELVIPAPVTAEVDFLLGRRLGRTARLGFIDDLAAGRFVPVRLRGRRPASSHRKIRPQLPSAPWRSSR